MCLSNLEGTLYLKDGLPCLVLDRKTTLEHLEEILDLCSRYSEDDVPTDDKIDIHIACSPPHRPVIKSLHGNLQTIALDLVDEGARIKIAPDVSLKGFLQVPDRMYRGAPTDWELGNCLFTPGH